MSNIPGICVVMVAAMLAAGCGEKTAAKGPPPAAKVIVATPLVKPIVEWDEYVGRLEAVEAVEVRARVGGYLQSTHFNEGQVVNKDDLLVVIDPKPFEAEKNRAKAVVAEAQAKKKEAAAAIIEAEAARRASQARLDLASIRVERVRLLAKQEATTKDERDTAEAEFTQATANLEAAKARIESVKALEVSAAAAEETALSTLAIAQLNLDYTKVRAPITGRASRRIVTDGNLISGGAAGSTLITTIVSLDPIHCYVDGDELSFLKYMRLAQSGRRQSSRDVKYPMFLALSDEKNGFPHEGHMDFIENRMDEQTGTMRARMILRNPDRLLTPGLFARVRIPGSERYEAVLVPDLAIGTDQSEKFIFVVEKDDTVRRQVVELGPIAHGLRVIRKGLTGSERIIIRGIQRVRPGDKVTTTTEKIELIPDGLPDHYEPVPEEKWLAPRRKQPEPAADTKAETPK